MTDWLLCAVDRTPHARAVVSVAARFARDLGLRLMVAHVEAAPQAEPAKRDEYAPGGADRHLASLTSAPSIRWDTVRRVESGDPAHELLRLAREHEARLLVAGSRGLGPLTGALLGSVSRRLAGESRCPVLVVPARVDPRRLPPQRLGRDPSVICGIDDSPEAELVLAHAAEMAWACSARLLLTHVVEAPRAPALPATPGVHPADYAALADVRRRAATRLLERSAAKVADAAHLELTLQHGEPVGEIETLADAEDADLIVVGSRGPRRLPAAVPGSVSAGLAGSASRPVLIVPETAASGRLGRFSPSLGATRPALAEAS